jgi:hypothetical protein
VQLGDMVCLTAVVQPTLLYTNLTMATSRTAQRVTGRRAPARAWP